MTGNIHIDKMTADNIYIYIIYNLRVLLHLCDVCFIHLHNDGLSYYD